MVDRSRRAPEVGVVMRDPAARTVHLLRRSRARDGQFLDHPRQRFDALGQVGGVDRPIVHLGIDVDRIFRAPGRLVRSEEHTSELQSLMRISYAVFCLKKKKTKKCTKSLQTNTINM